MGKAQAVIGAITSLFGGKGRHAPFDGFPRLVTDKPPIQLEAYDEDESIEERAYRLQITRLLAGRHELRF